jgi:uncharacterized DUF497 family protein/predicted DNA binding CopG/RHH family protein
MKFTWDEEKRKANLVKHGIDFTDTKAVFAGATFTFEDDRFTYDEQRFITLGMLKGTVVVIVHTERNKVIRIISIKRQPEMSKKSTSRDSQTDSKDSQTDWERVNGMQDEDIDLSDIPEITHDQIERATLRVGGKHVPKCKIRVNIFLDAQVVTYFKSQAGSRGYQTLINEALKASIRERDLETVLRRVIREELHSTKGL